MPQFLSFLRAFTTRRAAAERPETLATVREAMGRGQTVIAFYRYEWVMFAPVVLGALRDEPYVLGWTVTGSDVPPEDPTRWRWYWVPDLAPAFVGVPQARGMRPEPPPLGQGGLT